MESKYVAIGAYPLHICDRRQFDRACGKKNYEPASNRIGLALGNHLYPSCYYYLANDGVGGQHSFRAVLFLQNLPDADGTQNGFREKQQQG